MALQKELPGKVTGALIFLAALREASMSKVTYSLMGALCNESLGF